MEASTMSTHLGGPHYIRPQDRGKPPKRATEVVDSEVPDSAVGDLPEAQPPQGSGKGGVAPVE